MAVADGFHVDTTGNLWLGSNRETFDATTRSEAPFYVYANGDLVANSGTFSGDISGSTITGGSINIGNGTFQVDSSGNLTATSASISGVISAGGAANDINNNSTQISGGKIQANSLDVNSVITNDLSFSNLSIDSQNIIDTLVDNAILDTITNGSISDTKLGNISANKITAGTMSADRISGGTIDAGLITSGTLSLGPMTVDATGFVATGSVSILPSNSNSSIGNGNNSLAGYSLTVYGGGEIRGTLTSDTLKDRNSSSLIDFASTYIDIKPNNQLKYRFSTAQFTSYDDIRPSPDNTYDLGGSTLRWDDVFATNGTIQTSDVTLKENIQTTDLGLDFVNDLNPIEFTWIDGGVRTHLGFSAQDIKEKLITHKGEDQNMAVYTQGSYETQYVENEDGELVETDNPIERYGLRSNELIPVLTKAIQELSAKNDELESRLAALEG